MKNYQKIDTKKYMLKFEKPRLLRILSNNKIQIKKNYLNTKSNYNHKTSLSPLIIGNNNKNKYVKSPIKTYNYIKDVNNNNIIKTTPLKYQYKKLPFDKMRGFKIKLNNPIKNKNNSYLNSLNNNNRKNIVDTPQNYYPIIYNHNLSTIQSNIPIKTEKHKHSSSFSYLNLNYNNLNKKSIINNINTETNKNNIDNLINKTKKMLINNDNKKPLYHLLTETKSSSIGSKLETREASRHFSNNNNKIDTNFHFHKFNNNINKKLTVSSKKKILKYLDKTIKQLNKIKTIILDEKEDDEAKPQEDINQNFLKIIKKNNNNNNKDIK
jgi:hypothetical protein